MPSRPSSLRVLQKSLHFLSGGWMISVGWLWFAQLEQSFRRDGLPPPDYAVATIVEGIVPALLIELMAALFAKWMVTAPGTADPRREWHHAFWWTVVPNLMLIGTAYLMILEGS